MAVFSRWLEGIQRQLAEACGMVKELAIRAEEDIHPAEGPTALEGELLATACSQPGLIDRRRGVRTARGGSLRRTRPEARAPQVATVQMRRDAGCW